MVWQHIVAVSWGVHKQYYVIHAYLPTLVIVSCHMKNHMPWIRLACQKSGLRCYQGPRMSQCTSDPLPLWRVGGLGKEIFIFCGLLPTASRGASRCSEIPWVTTLWFLMLTYISSLHGESHHISIRATPVGSLQQLETASKQLSNQSSSNQSSTIKQPIEQAAQGKQASINHKQQVSKQHTAKEAGI